MRVVTAPRQSKQSREFQVLWYEYKPPGYSRLCRSSPEILPAKLRRSSSASPPAEKATARQDQAGKARNSDGVWNAQANAIGVPKLRTPMSVRNKKSLRTIDILQQWACLSLIVARMF
jgi:hypothetical protein